MVMGAGVVEEEEVVLGVSGIAAKYPLDFAVVEGGRNAIAGAANTFCMAGFGMDC